MRSVCSRRKLSSTARTIRILAAPLPFDPLVMRKRNFVARTTSSRFLLAENQRPITCSVSPSLPYTSAVSKKLTPAASASSMMRPAVASSHPTLCMNEVESASPKVIVPRHSFDTRRPLRPSCRYSMASSRPIRPGATLRPHTTELTAIKRPIPTVPTNHGCASASPFGPPTGRRGSP
jgi:hypothetical protein